MISYDLIFISYCYFLFPFPIFILLSFHHYIHLFFQEAAHLPVLLQVGADKEVGTGGKSVEIGDKLEEEGLEGVTIFDEPQKKVRQKLADGVYINFCLDLKNKLKL